VKGKQMNVLSYTREEFVLQVEGRPHAAVILTPAVLTRKPAMLLCPGECVTGIRSESDLHISQKVFLSTGHRVASFALPNHGDQVNGYGEGLEGMAASIAAGNDVFGEIRRTGTAFIDLVMDKGLTADGVILLEGISRGGIAALNIMAADRRVSAAALHAPVTYLPAVREFAHLENSEIVTRANAVALVEQLADRHVFISIGETDRRISSPHSFDFHARLSAASRKVRPVLFALPGESHGYTCPYEIGLYAGAAFLLTVCANRMKEKV